MKLALAQLNTTVGDFDGNLALIRAAYEKAAAAKADLVLTPELALTGYPPRDLLLRPSFVARNLAALDALARETGETGLVVGFVGEHGEEPGRDATNSVALLHRGRLAAVRHKTLLPSYDVFDEDRYFEPASENRPVEFKGTRLGLTICEDLWNDEMFWPDRRYRRDPAAELTAAGAQLLVNISASPWHLGKNRVRHAMLEAVARHHGIPLAYCNSVGGNDELIFDGVSLGIDATGRLIARGAAFADDLVFLDTDNPEARSLPALDLEGEEKLHAALVLGLRDYLNKCGFRSAVLGLSGGIDSALTAALAVAALGAENVHGVALPSQYSSPGSLADAEALARNLGIRYDVVPIQAGFEAVKAGVAPLFGDRPEDVTEEIGRAHV